MKEIKNKIKITLCGENIAVFAFSTFFVSEVPKRQQVATEKNVKKL
jgi:hypothetical protein